jgi:AhpD family alkylhydroperoxidase
MKIALTITMFLALAATAGVAAADRKTAPPPPSRATATLAEIEKALGFVPGFVRAIPPSLLPSWWDAAVSFEDSPDTRLDGRTKQLIALAVAAQVPCEYCIAYHSEAARVYGASEQELQEAVAMAASVRQNSTILNGMQVDRAQFRKDLDRIMKLMRAAMKK